MKTRILSLACLTFLLFSAAPSHADEFDEIIALLEAFANKSINNPALVQACMGFTANPVLCDVGDVAGSGLVCPPPPTPAEADHHCDISTAASLDASFATKLGQLLRLQAEFTTHFVMVGKESSIPAHQHKVDCSGSSCAQRYVKRFDSVDILFASAQKGKISSSPITSVEQLTAFVGSLKGVKSKSFSVGAHHYCTWVDHGDPRTCGVKGPITPGGTTTTGDGTTTGEPGGTTGEVCTIGDAETLPIPDGGN